MHFEWKITLSKKSLTCNKGVEGGSLGAPDFYSAVISGGDRFE